MLSGPLAGHWFAHERGCLMNEQAQGLDTLMSCPFCGGKARLEYATLAWEAGCADDGCVGHGDLSFDNADDAIAAWNTRATAPVATAGAVTRVNKDTIEAALYFLRSSDRIEMHGNQLERIDAALQWLDTLKAQT